MCNVDIVVGGDEAVLVLYQDRQFNFNNAVPTKPQFFRDFVDSGKMYSDLAYIPFKVSFRS